MAQSGESDIPRVGGMLCVSEPGVQGAAVAVEVGVRQDFHGCTMLIRVNADVQWELQLSDDAGAFLAGYIAGASGVTFGGE